MPTPFDRFRSRFSPTFGRVSGRRGQRRPAGISRRQWSLEPLEDRRVMAANLITGDVPAGSGLEDVVITYKTFDNTTALGQLQSLQDELDWIRRAQTDPTIYEPTYVVNSIPSDPLLSQQWFLINTGQAVGNPDYQPIFGTPGEDINVAPAWLAGYTGEGVTVAVIDSGVQTNHPDLAANISSTLFFDGTVVNGAIGDPNPTPSIVIQDPITGEYFYFPIDAHGTAVAGEIGAVANNGIGGTGVAPGVEIVPVKLITGGVFPSRFAQAFRYETDVIDITNNSWGPAVDRGLAGPDPAEFSALRDSIFFGRDGKGVIHVFASGNSAGPRFNTGFDSIGSYDSSGYNGWVNSRYTIGVTGVDHDGFYNNADGTVLAYPEISASVLVAAPTGSNGGAFAGDDSGIGSGIVTTDLTGTVQSGNGGFNIPPDGTTGQEFDNDFLADDDYTSRFNGTSAAAPIVSGVIALMLEANPDLTWRDVQEILVRSARQNAPLETPANGEVQGFETGFQNLWVQNQLPVFHDPDIYQPGIDPFLQTRNPTLDPTDFFLGFNHYAPSPITMTNGAGYTVSMGRGAYGEQIGYGHGVVDAGLAVLMAEQWGEKNQTLPRELTFTTFVSIAAENLNLPAVETLGDDEGNQIIPGRPGGEAGFSAYWQEYFADEPDFDQDFPGPGFPLEFRVPANNAMTVETVDVKIAIRGDAAGTLDNVRMTLVSPNGTHSELNNFWIEPLPPFNAMNEFIGSPIVGVGGIIGPIGNGLNFSSQIIHGDPGSVDTQGTGSMVATFSTNRSWGERSDAAYVFDPTTGMPISNTLFDQGWTLHIENYGSSALAIDDIELVWHGSPISADTQRVAGKIGIDENRDDLFNYTRVITGQGFDIDGDPTVNRFGEVANAVDLSQEAFASNITVNVRRASDNVLVDQFITGADGNYYFDLIPDEYILSIEDPLGRTAVEDTITAAGQLQNYKTEWRITPDWFKIRQLDEGFRSAIDPSTGAPFAWEDPSTLDSVDYGVYEVNFLLDPGGTQLNEVNFAGIVFADFNSDGVLNGDDYLVPGVNVFGDLNQNGLVDPGEELAQTDAAGAYSLTVPLDFNTVMNVGVIRPLGWSFTDPANGLEPFFVRPGDSASGINFGIKPPAGGNTGDPNSSAPGLITGVVFDDVNKDSTRQTGEAGIAGMRVYVDSNNSGTFDAGDIGTLSSSSGTYVFAGLAPGTYRLRIEAPAPLLQTRPLQGGSYQVTLLGGGTITGLLFGINNPAINDYGDLPFPYPTTLAQNGARHGKSAYYLGSSVDTEFDGRPIDAAEYPDGDNTIGFDEDGIVIDPLVAGATGRLVAIASRHGGYLQGWIDFNNNGNFNDPGERIITNKLLVPDANEIFFQIPDEILGTTLYARFRYGEFGINAVTGAAQIGEVEDYAIPYAPPIPSNPAVIAGYPGDFNDNARVDGFDFLALQRGLGVSSSAAHSSGDANRDGKIDGADLGAWASQFGEGDLPAAVAVAPVTGDFDLSGEADGADFLNFQRHFGATGAARIDGDGDGDGSVGNIDRMAWEIMFGSTSGPTTLSSNVSANSLTTTIHVAAEASPPPSAPSNGVPSTYERQLAGLARRGGFVQPVTNANLRSSWGKSDESAIDAALESIPSAVARAERLFDEHRSTRRRTEWVDEAQTLAEEDEIDADVVFEWLADEV